MYTMGLIALLNPLINASYFCVNPYEEPLSQQVENSSTNAATNFFRTLFDSKAMAMAA